MTTRRELLSRAAGAAGLAFTACGVHRAAFAQAAGTQAAAPHRRREVVVSGKRVRTIDVHAHCHIPEALALAGKKVQFPALVMAPKRIELMDEQGIDIEALSINPNF